MKISNEENSLKIVDVGEEVLQEGEAVGAACVRPQLVIPDQRYKCTNTNTNTQIQIQIQIQIQMQIQCMPSTGHT